MPSPRPRKPGMTKYITMLQNWQRHFPMLFEERFGLKVQRIGYTDSSTTEYMFSVRTKKSVEEVQDMVWEINHGGWARVTA